MNKNNSFQWTKFYQEFSNKLLEYKNNRQQLLIIMEKVFSQTDMKYPFTYNGKPLKDICPFTVFGCFNKGIKDENRKNVLTLLSKEFGISEEVPYTFEGIPVLNNMMSWFFSDVENKTNDISNLWSMFEAAIDYADNPSDLSKITFINNYDIVKNQSCVKWNLSMGLYWIRPYSYLNLDERNRRYLTSDNSITLLLIIFFVKSLKTPPDAEKYLSMIEKCKELFIKQECDFHSFPELSYISWENTLSDEDNMKISKANFLK